MKKLIGQKYDSYGWNYEVMEKAEGTMYWVHCKESDAKFRLTACEIKLALK